MTQMVDCYYNEFVKFAERYGIYYDEVSSTIYNWYKNAYKLAESAQLGALNAYSKSSRKKIIYDWSLKEQKLEQRLFKDLDYTIQNVAYIQNAEYYESIKEAVEKNNTQKKNLIKKKSDTGLKKLLKKIY